MVYRVHYTAILGLTDLKWKFEHKKNSDSDARIIHNFAGLE